MNKRILCLDIGEKRIGCALSDPTGTISTPHSTIHVRNFDQVTADIKKIINEYNVVKIVAGLPIMLNSEKGIQAQKILKFISDIESKISIPVETYDERFTTKIAENVMISADVSREKRKEKIDMLAASITLQAYLDKNNEKKNI